jgi:hypothetical protein
MREDYFTTRMESQMTIPFSDLSTEGKLAKLDQHVEGGHPVPSQWVSWIVKGFVPSDNLPTAPAEILTAFNDVGDADKLEKIVYHINERTMPASWVKWLLNEYIPSKPTLSADGPGF